MSQTNGPTDDDEGTADGERGDGTETSLGVYYVPSDELVQPAAERTYHQRVLWTDDGWSPTSNGEFVERAPEERTRGAFTDEFATRNYFVMTPDAVPGTVEIEEPDFTIADLNLDESVADDDGTDGDDTR